MIRANVGLLCNANVNSNKFKFNFVIYLLLKKFHPLLFYANYKFFILCILKFQTRNAVKILIDLSRYVWFIAACWEAFCVNILLSTNLLFMKNILVYVYKLFGASHWFGLRIEIIKIHTYIRYTFLSNQYVHKSSCGLCFWAPDPLIHRF